LSIFVITVERAVMTDERTELNRLVAEGRALSQSVPLTIALLAGFVAIGWLIPPILGHPTLLQGYWLALPAVAAGVRFGITGAVVTSTAGWLVSGPLAVDFEAARRPTPGDWIGEAAFLLTVSLAVAFLVRRTRQADAKVLALVTAQRESARSAARERGNLTQELQRRINLDALTGLANRAAFLSQLEEELRVAPYRTAVLFIDLDDFKTVNDTLGHAVGDELIVAVAGRLAGGSRGGDLVARFGGDEFAVLLTDVSAADALRPARRILAELKAPFNLCGRTLVVRASGGLAVSEDNIQVGAEQRAQDLLKQADLAMYASKMQRSRDVTLFHEGMQTEMLERMSLESDMSRALADAQFFLDYQPIVEMQSGQVRAVEALLRWHHPDRGLIPPSDFIPVAEQTGMIVALTLWVVRHAAKQLRAWDEDPVTEGLTIALNVSGRLAVEPGIGAALAREIHHAGVDPRRIILEITESLLMEERGVAVQTLCQLRALGMRLSVDDFGTGYSSLSRLNTLPIDEVKIDRSFVEQLDAEAGRTIVTATIAMAHGLGLRVVAEGVENDRQRAALLAAGCDDGQGYLYSRPVSPENVATVIAGTAEPVATLGGVPRQAQALADPARAAS
jgi:diguanylate cyclase (GGDEF)-like protein